MIAQQSINASTPIAIDPPNTNRSPNGLSMLLLETHFMIPTVRTIKGAINKIDPIVLIRQYVGLQQQLKSE